MAELAIPENPSVVPVPFHGDEILTVEVKGKVHVILRPALEAIGVDYAAQYTKLKSRSWATIGRCTTVAADRRMRDMVTVDVQTFLMLLANIDENRVGYDVKPKLVLYQAEVAKAIEDYWTKGAAINPRAVKPMSLAEIALVNAQALVEHEQRLDRIDGDVAVLGARVDGIEQRTGWFVALAYAKLNKLPTDTKSLRRLGVEASRIARREGIAPAQVPNEAYGFVNSYPEEIWREASAIFQRAAR